MARKRSTVGRRKDTGKDILRVGEETEVASRTRLIENLQGEMICERLEEKMAHTSVRVKVIWRAFSKNMSLG